MADDRVDDNIQHGIDDDPHNDPAKGAAIGGIGGAVTGAVAGSAVGPVGSVVGAVIGGVAGAVASGAAVAAIDQMDNDNTVTGVGHGVSYDEAQLDEEEIGDEMTEPVHAAPSATATPLGPGPYATGTNYDRRDMGTLDTMPANRTDDTTGKPIG